MKKKQKQQPKQNETLADTHSESKKSRFSVSASERKEKLHTKIKT